MRFQNKIFIKNPLFLYEICKHENSLYVPAVKVNVKRTNLTSKLNFRSRRLLERRDLEQYTSVF